MLGGESPGRRPSKRSTSCQPRHISPAFHCLPSGPHLTARCSLSNCSFLHFRLTLPFSAQLISLPPSEIFSSCGTYSLRSTYRLPFSLLNCRLLNVTAGMFFVFFFLHPYCCLQQFSDLPCANKSPWEACPEPSSPALLHRNTAPHLLSLGADVLACVELMPKCFVLHPQSILYFHTSCSEPL